MAAPGGIPEVLEEMEGLHLIEVVDPEHLRIWNELMISEHPLKKCRLVGRQLRYLIGSEHGWLGGIGFGSAALRLEGRDDWIGWKGWQRSEHLERVLNMVDALRMERRVQAGPSRNSGIVSWGTSD